MERRCANLWLRYFFLKQAVWKFKFLSMVNLIKFQSRYSIIFFSITFYTKRGTYRAPKTKTVMKVSCNWVLNTYRQIFSDNDTSIESVKNKVIAYTKQMYRKEMLLLCSVNEGKVNMKSNMDSDKRSSKRRGWFFEHHDWLLRTGYKQSQTNF